MQSLEFVYVTASTKYKKNVGTHPELVQRTAGYKLNKINK